MKLYFPKPYPMETLTSLVARYAMHTGYTDNLELFKYFFNYRQGESGIFGYDSIKYFHGIVKSIWNVKLTYLVDNHTEYWFRYPFSEGPDLSNSGGGKYNCKLSMLDDKENYRIYSNIKRYTYCDSCVKDDRIQYGEAFYKVIHDVYNIKYCMIHGEELLRFDVGASNSSKCLALEYIYGTANSEKINKSESWKQHDIEVVINKYYLEIAKNRNLPIVSRNKWANYYRLVISEKFGSFRSEVELSNAVYNFSSRLEENSRILSGASNFSSIALRVLKNIYPKRCRRIIDLEDKEHFSLWFVFCFEKTVDQIFTEAYSCSDSLPYKKLRRS